MERLLRLLVAGQRARARERDRAGRGARDHGGGAARAAARVAVRRPGARRTLPSIGDGFSLDEHLLSRRGAPAAEALASAGGDRAGPRACSGSPPARCATSSQKHGSRPTKLTERQDLSARRRAVA